MNTLSLIGNLASVVGLLVSLYTLYKVANLPRALKQYAHDKQLSELIDNINELPPTKGKLVKSTTDKIEVIIFLLRTHYISIVPFRHKTLKSLLAALVSEVEGARRLEVIQNQLRLIHNEITIR